jgi:translocator protein
MDTTTSSPSARAARRWLVLAGFLAASFAAGAIGNLLQGGDVGAAYLALDRPAWAPPQTAFGIVWPVLYVVVAVAAWRVWSRAGWAGARTALVLWAVQLVVNSLWPGVFFGLEAFGAALGVIVVLAILIAATLVRFAQHDRPAALLFAPYLLWVLYAAALNAAIWRSN